VPDDEQLVCQSLPRPSLLRPPERKPLSPKRLKHSTTTSQRPQPHRGDYTRVFFV
jgi:hypothetical protein